MKKFPKLNLPSYPQRVSKDPQCGAMRIWDRLRGVWLVLTPEEWVRRHVVEYLINDRGISHTHISQEYPVCISGMPQRADIVITGKDASAVLLVECKAPDIRIDEMVYGQAVRYNAVVQAEYIMLTNGMAHYIFRRDGEGNYNKCDEVPSMDVFFR